MDIEKIEELKARRKRVKKEVRFKKLRDRVKSQITHLERLGEPFIVYYNFENLNYIDSNIRVRNKDGYRGIHGDFQIDVDDSKALSDVKIKEDEIDSDKFSKLFSSVIPENSSLIVCYQGGDPELEISNKAFLSKPTIFFAQPETWVITTDKNWIIEYLWDQGVIRFIDVQNSSPTLIKKIVIEY